MKLRRDYLAFAFADAVVVELRHQISDRWTSGLFSDPVRLRSAVADLCGSGNLYTSLNAPVGVEVTNAMTSRALRDADIGTIVRLPFDFDPVRPAGVPSTDGELHLARRQRDRFVGMLLGLGWPLPAVATSGNGTHALYRCRFPATPELADMLANLYKGLKSEWSTDAVRFDSTVRSAAQVWRLYGTANRKGTSGADRPHRKSNVELPHRWQGVSPRQVEALANRYAGRPAITPRPCTAMPPMGAGDFRTLDVVAWFKAHGLYKRRLGGGKHAVWCPWQHEHTTPSTACSSDVVVWEADGGGWPTFHCAHDHCRDVRRLTDVMALFRDADAFCARPFGRTAA